MLDGDREPTLVLGTHPGAPPRQDLGGVGDKAAQHPAVSIRGDLLLAGTKRANLRATSTASPAAAIVAVAFIPSVAAVTFTTVTSRLCHLKG